MLQICIGSICLVSATPPTVLGQSFWNFTGTLQLSFDFTWEICHLLDITAVAGHLAWLAVLLAACNRNYKIKTFSKLRGLKANYAHHLSNWTKHLKRRCNTSKQDKQTNFIRQKAFMYIHVLKNWMHSYKGKSIFITAQTISPRNTVNR